MERKLNYVAIVVGGIVYWIIQAGWYTALGAQWQVAAGVNPAQQMQQGGTSPVPFLGSLICDIIVAWALAWVLTRTGRTSALAGAVTGAALSIGFIATILLTNYLFEQRTRELFYINAGVALIGMAVTGAIVGAWQKKDGRATAAAA